MPAVHEDVFAVFQKYSRLYELRNAQAGHLSPELQQEWVEVTFTMESIFSGLYRPETPERQRTHVPAAVLRERMPVTFLRVPTEADVLCETGDNFFSGKLTDISLGGAYVHAPVPFRVDDSVRLTFCAFRDRQPIEVEARVAWSNPGGVRKQSFPEGAGMQFTVADGASRQQLSDYVYELVEETLSRANLI